MALFYRSVPLTDKTVPLINESLAEIRKYKEIKGTMHADEKSFVTHYSTSALASELMSYALIGYYLLPSRIIITL